MHIIEQTNIKALIHTFPLLKMNLNVSTAISQTSNIKISMAAKHIKNISISPLMF